MIDADADIGRRAWLPCARCDAGARCSACTGGRNCHLHWAYLLGVETGNVFLQCPACHHRWWQDTGFGRGEAPAGIAELPDFPPFIQAA